MIRNFTLLFLLGLLVHPSFLSAQWNVRTFSGSGLEGFKDGDPTTAKFWNPKDMVVDAVGNIYVADDYNARIRKIEPDGTVSTFAGTGEPGFLDGNVNDAQFSRPQGIDLDSEGNFYVADAGNLCIRKITPDGQVSLLAGIPENSGTNDGFFQDATFAFPATLSVSGNKLYVGDNNLIRELDLEEGTVTTVHSGQYLIWGLDTDNLGNVYFAEFDNFKIKVLTTDGSTITLAGSGNPGCMDGDADNAQFTGPEGVVVDDMGNVYVADGLNNRIRHIAPNGTVTTIAGSGNCSVDGWTETPIVNGVGEFAQFGRPRGICLNSDGNLLITSWGNDAVRELELGAGSPPISAFMSDVIRDFEIATPKHVTPISFESAVQNTLDAEMIEDVSVAVNIYLDGNLEFSQESDPLNMSPGDIDVLDLEEQFLPEKVGHYEVIFEYKAPTLGTFETFRDEFEISDSTWAKDDGHEYFNFAFLQVIDDSTFTNVSYGVQFDLEIGDTLKGVNYGGFFFGNGFKFHVHEMPDDATVGSVLVSSDSTDFPEFTRDYYWQLETPTYLPPGKYLFVAEKNEESSIHGIGADSDNRTKTNWVISPGLNLPFWAPIHQIFMDADYMALMIRPNFAPDIISNTDNPEKLIPTLTISPNPASNWLNIQFSETIKKGYFEIIDARGRTAISEKFESSEGLQKDINHLNPGAYFVRIWNGEAWGIGKFVKD